MSYDNDNEGAIWKNEKREKDTHPHFTGSATIEGVEYWVSAWKRGDDASDKAPALKFSFKPKQERQSAPAAPAKGSDFADDDIPW
jgi:hypothetical protein